MIGKNDIVKRLAIKRCGTQNNVHLRDLQECAQFCDDLAEIFTEAFMSGEKITWQGLLTTEVVDRKARRGRNPKTNEIVMFPAVKLPRCRISEQIKEKMNE